MPRQFLGFRGAAAVVPEDGGAHRPVGRVEQQSAVHLARQADALHAAEKTR